MDIINTRPCSFSIELVTVEEAQYSNAIPRGDAVYWVSKRGNNKLQRITATPDEKLWREGETHCLICVSLFGWNFLFEFRVP